MWQQTKMRREFEARRRAVGREVAELCQRREALKQELARRSEECRRSSSQLEEARARLKALNTKLVVIAQRLKETHAETAFRRRQGSDLSQEAGALHKELARHEAEVRQLVQQQAEPGEGGAATEPAQEELLTAIAAIGGKKRQELANAAPCSSKRAELTKELAQKPLNLERSEEPNVSLKLMHALAERDRLRKALAERAHTRAGPRKSLAALEKRLQDLEEARVLESARSSLTSARGELKKESAAFEQRIAEHQKLRASKQQELDGLTRSNADKAKAVADLEDKIGQFDELTEKIKVAQARLADLSRSNEQGLADIKALFADNLRLAGEFWRLEELLKALDRLPAPKLGKRRRMRPPAIKAALCLQERASGR